jgi:hypothetical protein
MDMGEGDKPILLEMRPRFPPPFYGGGAERSEAKGVAVLSNLRHRRSHPFRQALRALPRKTGEEKKVRT